PCLVFLHPVARTVMASGSADLYGPRRWYNRGVADPLEQTLIRPKAEQQLQRPRMWRVLLHNDDYTTQDFVGWVLETVFHKPRGEAFAIMMSVHQSGLGVAGVFTHDVADTKVRTTKSLAEDHEFPLLVTMEPEHSQ